MTYLQESPFSVQIELAEGCNLRCAFCGLNGIRAKDNNFKFMTRETLTKIMKSITARDWNPRFEFAMHGEPTMHPDYAKMIATARFHAPKHQIMMTSNGGGLLRQPGPVQNIVKLFEAGLNMLALDDYESVKIVDKIVEALDCEEFADAMSLMDIEVYNYPKEKQGNPHMRRKPTAHVLSIIKDISKADDGTHARLSNHAGAAAPKNDLMAGKRCARPFREISFRWDGSVAICCEDWRGTFKCGNINTDSLDEIWNGAAMQAARKKLYRGERDFGPCKGCDARSYRVGLLPDKLGKEDLGRATPYDMRAIDKALAGKPYSAPVLRPWEKP